MSAPTVARRFPRPMFAVRVLPAEALPGWGEQWRDGVSDADTPERVHDEIKEEMRRRQRDHFRMTHLRRLAAYLLYTCQEGATFRDVALACGDVGIERARQLATGGWHVAQRALPVGYLRLLETAWRPAATHWADGRWWNTPYSRHTTARPE